MLKRLSIRGLSVLSNVELELGAGLNVITGETGAGKSLVVSALSALLGRSSLDRVPGDVELEAVLGTRSGCADLVCALTRRGARLKARIDGQPVTLGELRERVAGSVLITAQGAVRELSSPASVRALLDERAGNLDLLERYRERRARCLALQQQAERIRSELAGGAEGGARVASLIEQAEATNIRCGEHSELVRRIELAAERQKYLDLCARIDRAVSEGDDALERQIAQLLAAVRRAPAHAALDDLAADLGAALAALQSANHQAARIAGELDVDAAELPLLEQRRELLEQLADHLGCAPDAVGEGIASVRAQRLRLDSLEAELEEINEQRALELAAAAELAEALYRARSAALEPLRDALVRELATLALENARIELSLARGTAELAPFGPGELVLHFSANPGQPLLPLGRVASGGERSRFVLALSCVGAAAARTLVFDEIDQGVGGEALSRLAQRLAELARTQQLICVTHQAAIAARASSHFRVEKRVHGGRTSTAVTRLDDEARTAELSRMLAGGRAADGARALARRLLAEARSAA